MKVVHVVPQIAREASGPSVSVARLCESLVDRGLDLHLHVLDYGKEFMACSVPISRHPDSKFLKRLGISPSMNQALRVASDSAAIIHNHSFWMMPNVYPAWAVRGKRCLLVHSPRGTLSPWALNRSRFVKFAFWTLLQGPSARAAACFHATSEPEYRDIRRKGLSVPIAIIPNGIDLPNLSIVQNSKFKIQNSGSKVLLFLGRLHPVKGVDLLLQSWGALETDFPDWRLVVAGPDEGGYLGTLRKMAGELGLQRLEFAGPLYGEEKQKAYRNADLYVLPTHTENFGMTIAEALAHGVPVITTRGAPWSGLEAERCGWWIEPGVQPLTICLRAALQKTAPELSEMGLGGRAWMERDFSWSAIAARMHQTYQWLVDPKCEPPTWVKLD